MKVVLAFMCALYPKPSENFF